MQSISDGCLRALSRRRPFRNRLTLPMLDHFKAQTKIGSQIRLQNLFVRVAQSYPANDSCIFQVKESTTIPIKPGRDLISEIVAGTQRVFIDQANLIEHTAEINELTHFCIRASQAIHRRHNKRNDKSSLLSSVNVGKVYKPRIDANAEESEPLIRVHSCALVVHQSPSPNREST